MISVREKRKVEFIKYERMEIDSTSSYVKEYEQEGVDW